MTTSNPFLIHTQENVIVKNLDDKSWVFEVGKNGNLWFDFLQMNADLHVQVNLNGEDANCKINCAYLVNKNNLFCNLHLRHSN